MWLGIASICIVVMEITPMKILFNHSDANLRPDCPRNHRCVPIQDCEKYQSATAIRRDRPRPCGFTGKVPLVCCPGQHMLGPDTTVEPVTTGGLPAENLFHLLPDECGYPYRNLFDLPSRPVPPGTGVAAGIGGRPAEQGKWPWMALLGRLSETGELGEWFCGGTLITGRHVLTAAHCVRPHQVGSVGARLGEHDLSTTRDVIHQDRNIVNIKRHERFQGVQNDIAVLRLDRPVESSRFIRPICLTAAGAEHDGREVEMAGFGYLEFAGALPDVLQEVPLRVSDSAACERAYSTLPQFEQRFPGGFQGTKICAVSRDAVPRDACPGDSGGPLMAERPDQLYELVGVVSAGVGCGNPEFPGVYTKVSAYIGWILSNLM